MKKTTDAALASLKHKVSGLQERIRIESGRAANLERLAFKTTQRNTELRESLRLVTEERNRYLEQVRELESSDIGTLTARLDGAEKRVEAHRSTVLNLRAALKSASMILTDRSNIIASLRSELRSQKQSATIYGILAVLAAYGAGIAFQHWCPIAF